jgi:ATP-dependent Lhr-like helicase
LNANPYAFLDDAPLEERRARAVEMRRTLPAQLAGEVGALDPAAIEEVQRESWPVVRDPDELHDALLTLLWLPVEEVKDWASHLPRLIDEGRAVELNVRGEAQEVRGWVATEHREKVETVLASGDDTTLDAIVLGWMESIGPTTAMELGTRLDLLVDVVSHSLQRLEASGQVLRGQSRPISRIENSKFKIENSGEAGAAPEWCHRRLLARIHRLTIGRLRKEVEPVTAHEFMRFLFQWQHVSPGSRLHGEAGLLDIIAQLAGFEAAASAWEPHLLRTRLAKYEPELLDRLCLNGAVSWGRLSPHPRFAHVGDLERRRIIPTSVAPISIFPREESDWLRDVFHDDDASNGPGSFAQLSSVAQDLRRTLHERGASFFTNLVRMTNHLPTEVEEGLWELVAAGLVTADGFDNLRALMDPRRRRAEGRERSRRPRHSAGRWALLRPAAGHQPPEISSEPASLVTSRLTSYASRSIEPVARQLLRRYGVVFRDLLGREALALSWRDLLMQYRRMELQGEIRGGRFVSGFTGEQFALPEAVESLRAVRKRNESSAASHDIKLSASDPLNLAGVILPGQRVPAVPSNFVVFRDGAVARAVLGREAADRPNEQSEWSGRTNQLSPHYS